MFRFESSNLTLEPHEEFILSIILVFVVALVTIIAYYNIVLALRGEAPFRVASFLPQILKEILLSLISEYIILTQFNLTSKMKLYSLPVIRKELVDFL